jgi:hypothetical protein
MFAVAGTGTVSDVGSRVFCGTGTVVDVCCMLVNVCW